MAAALTACSLNAPAKSAKPSAVEERIAIVASERGPLGVRLVAIDEHGDRRFALIAPPAVMTRDENPAVSPDGRWIVFASTRGRDVHGTTSLWIAPLGFEATPRRLTESSAVERFPVWLADGSAIVFSSTQAAGDFDLWRLAIDRDGKPGKLEQLTREPGHEVQATVGPDGTIIYASLVEQAGIQVDSRLVERALDGTLHELTAGPADSSPALSPDGKTLVFARPMVHEGIAHSELWWMHRGASDAHQLVDLPLTDESGPVWSPDGRFVFATSILKGAAGNALFSAVVYVDMQERAPRARILEDRAGAAVRLTPAVSAHRLDVAALHEDPEYLPELARIMAKKISEQAQQ